MSSHISAIDVEVGNHIQWEVFGLTWNVDTILGTIIAGAIVLGLGFYLRAKAKKQSAVEKPSAVQLFYETVTFF